jgi:hypothetical protein
VPTSSTDSAGNTYSRHAVISNGSERLAIFSAHAPAGLVGGSTITVTWSGNSAYTRVLAASFTGIASTNPVNSTNALAPAGTGTAWATGPATTSVSDTLLVGAAGIAGDRTSTPGAGWVEIHDVHGASADEGTTSVYRTVSSTGSYEATGTWSSAGAPRVGAIVAFAGSGTSPTSLAGTNVFSAVRALQLGALRTSSRAATQTYRRRHTRATLRR